MQKELGQYCRSTIRWSSGLILTGAIVTSAYFLFPQTVAGHPGGWVLTIVMAALVGLMVSLPPLEDADDWVRVGLKEDSPEIELQHESTPVIERPALPQPLLEPPIREVAVLIPMDRCYIDRCLINPFPNTNLPLGRLPRDPSKLGNRALTSAALT